MWRAIRIVILLFILATVAQGAWIARARTANWNETLRVAIYPIESDGAAGTAAYVRSLRREQFEPIDAFFRHEAERHGLPLTAPIEVYLAARVDSIPPAPPAAAGTMDSILWSLQMRFWAWRNDAYAGPRPHVRIFVLYFDPPQRQRLAHSVGLQKGMIGRVNAFADNGMTATNNVIIAHELLHTLGAIDKYDPASGRPRFPDGYAEPKLDPLHPQRYAEIMAGRIPLEPTRAEIPRTLDETLIGAATAREINWLK